MKKTIVIESMYLYNYNSPESGITVGGSQRYSLDLGRMFYKLGYEVIYITKANVNMENEYEGWAKIIAFDSPYGEKGRINFSKRVYSYCKKIKPDLTCYSDLEIGFPYCYENSFALQHGIDWDTPYNRLKSFVKTYFTLKAMHKFKRVICVDTNFINWCRERDVHYFENPEKLVYIPNYADEIQFNYNFREWKKDEEFKLLYPRRLVTHRGFKIFMEMCEQLLKKGYNIKPILAFEEFKGLNFKKEYPQYSQLNCEIVHPDMNQIQEYYKEAFLSFVPTRWSEGTSLSAIEAISTGCPVIVSDVGGLGNIVLSGFNGYIIPPSVSEFVSKTEELLNNVEKRNELSRNCESMNKIFGKKRWEAQVFNTIKSLL
jgi:glycosyltransferase involved in cell wall biosynthesis